MNADTLVHANERLPKATRSIARRMRLAGLALVLLAVAACSSEASKLENVYLLSQSKGQAAAAAEMRKAWYAKDITLQAAISLAHDKVEKQKDIAAATFAAAVLQTVAEVEPDIPQKDINDFFYVRLGTLAANSAAIAWNAQPRDLALARKLVLAGPKTWQTDKYWMDHADHDALASYILFENNEGTEALDRLRSRPELLDETAKAYDEIEKEMRRRRR